MAWRTTEEDVRSVIDADDDKLVRPFIDIANDLVDFIVTQDTDGLLTAARQKNIECLLSAHFYAHLDPQYTEKKTGEASAKFQGQYGMALDGSDWGQSAKMLDVTGTLAKMEKGFKRPKFAWLGLPPSSQTNVRDRD